MKSAASLLALLYAERRLIQQLLEAEQQSIRLRETDALNGQGGDPDRIQQLIQHAILRRRGDALEIAPASLQWLQQVLGLQSPGPDWLLNQAQPTIYPLLTELAPQTRQATSQCLRRIQAEVEAALTWAQDLQWGLIPFPAPPTNSPRRLTEVLTELTQFLSRVLPRLDAQLSVITLDVLEEITATQQAMKALAAGSRHVHIFRLKRLLERGELRKETQVDALLTAESAVPLQKRKAVSLPIGLPQLDQPGSFPSLLKISKGQK
jgi:hypothetical protein